MDTPPATRPYDSVRSRVFPHGSRDDRLQQLVDLLWDVLNPTGVSWIGFYVTGENPDELVLAARRNKPACSPISMKGACGRSFQSKKKALVVTDVEKLGEGYIACDPRDKSEVVVPLIEFGGAPWGVLDADSYDANSFTEADALALNEILVTANLTAPGPIGVETV